MCASYTCERKDYSGQLFDFTGKSQTAPSGLQRSINAGVWPHRNALARLLLLASPLEAAILRRRRTRAVVPRRSRPFPSIEDEDVSRTPAPADSG